MELRQLRYFSEAAELLNFTEAARRLFVTQSTLSQQIKQLEEELGIPLFNRIGKHVSLTEAGESFLPYARQTLQNAEYGKQKLRDLQQIHYGTLRIGVTYSLSPLLTNTILIFTRLYPGIQLDIRYFSSSELVERLRNHEFDFILSFLPQQKEELFEAIPLFDSSLVMVVHRNHPLAQTTKVNWSQLQQQPFIVVPAMGLSARMVLDGLLTHHRTRLTPTIETNDVSLILQLIRTRSWISFLSKATILDQTELKGIAIPEKKALMQASLMWLKDAYQKSSAVAFRQILEQEAGKYRASSDQQK